MSFKDRQLHWTCKQAIATGKIVFTRVFKGMQIKAMMLYYFPVITGNTTKNDTSITGEDLRKETSEILTQGKCNNGLFSHFWRPDAPNILKKVQTLRPRNSPLWILKKNLDKLFR